MQRDLIQTLQGSLFPNSHIVNVDYAALLELSNRSRLDSISALIQQYQRFKVAAPVTRNTLRIEASPSEAHKASRFESSRRTANDSRDSWLISPVGGDTGSLTQLDSQSINITELITLSSLATSRGDLNHP
jgi:hypothetical protein